MDSKRRINRSGAGRASPTIIGQARNQHGTRMCHRVECAKCHGVDHIAVRAPRDGVQLCRLCAEKYLAIYDLGRRIEQEKVSKRCQRCRKDFLVSEAVVQKKENLLCLDCLRGFDVWRGKPGSRDKGGAGKERTLIRTGSLTIFRKKIDESL